MVSMVVMGVLMAVLLPAVAHVRHMAKRTECRSNIRQQGLALQMYAYDRSGRLPQSVFSKDDPSYAWAPQETVNLRVDPATHPMFAGASKATARQQWDALGHLYKHDYISSPEIFYCPSNDGHLDHPQFAAQFAGEPGAIVGNYQLRLLEAREYLSNLDPNLALISNSLRSPIEYSHRDGNNVLSADMSVSWFQDTSGSLLTSLGSSIAVSGRDEMSGVEYAWALMDTDGRFAQSRRQGGGPEDEQDTSDRLDLYGN